MHLCALIVMRAAHQAGLFWLYYQPLLPAVAMLWMWAAAVRFFEGRVIKYDVCFSPQDQKYLLPSRSIFQVGLQFALVCTLRISLSAQIKQTDARVDGCYRVVTKWTLRTV